MAVRWQWQNFHCIRVQNSITTLQGRHNVPSLQCLSFFQCLYTECGLPPHPARRGRRPTFPSRGRQGAKPFSCRTIFTVSSFQTPAPYSRAAYSLPLEGKVSAEPTDEVFILIYTAYVPTGNITTIAVEHRTSDARPYGCGILSALSFRKWEYTEHCRRI